MAKKHPIQTDLEAYDAEAEKAYGLTEVTVLPPEAPQAQLLDLSTAFERARAHVSEIRELGRRANHVSILLGQELNRLKKTLGVQRGGDRGAKSQTATLPPWRDLVAQQTGLSYDTCQRCMDLAEAAKKHIVLLTAKDVINTPFAQLPEARQKQVTDAIKKAVSLQSMTQLMLDFGVAAPKKINRPPPGGKSAKNNFQGGANADGEDETEASRLESLRALAKDEHLNGNMGVKAMLLSEAWTALEDDDLADLDNTLDQWRQQIATLMTERQTATLKAAGKGKKKVA